MTENKLLLYHVHKCVYRALWAFTSAHELPSTFPSPFSSLLVALLLSDLFIKDSENLEDHVILVIVCLLYFAQHDDL